MMVIGERDALEDIPQAMDYKEINTSSLML